MEAKTLNEIDFELIPDKVKIDLCFEAIKMAMKKPPCGNMTATATECVAERTL